MVLKWYEYVTTIKKKTFIYYSLLSKVAIFIIHFTTTILKKNLNCFNSRVAGYRFLLICLNSWHTAKLYIFGKSRMWLIEISMSSLSSVVTLWDNLGQRSNPYFSKKKWSDFSNIFFARIFRYFYTKNSRSGWEIIKVYNPISFYGCQGIVTAVVHNVL